MSATCRKHPQRFQGTSNCLPFRLLQWFVCFLVAASSVSANEFEQANQLYEKGQFAEAKQKYEQLVASNDWTANLFYNLGNTDFRLGSEGRATLGYERALALEPNHPEARRNLELLRERAGSRVPPRPWYAVLFPNWNVDAFTLICTVSVWVAVFSAVLSLIARKHRDLIGWIGVIAFCVAAYAGAGVWRAERGQSRAVIISKEAVVRLAPAEQSEVAGALPAGSVVNVIAERGDWIYCRLPGDELGWLPEGVLEKIRI